MLNNSIIGVDLGGTNIRVGKVCNLILNKVIEKKISAKESADFIVDEVINTVNIIFDENVEGIGIGVPSVVDIERGIIYDVQNIPSWKEVHLKSLLEKKFNVPVFVNNDANCFVMGEKYFGKGKIYDNIVGLIMGTGLGSGIIIDHKLYLGANNGAGEFGMISYLDKNYEFYCSGQFFKNKYNISGEEFFRRAQVGDDFALSVFNEYGKHLGNACKTILFSVDPNVLIFGGSVSKAFKYFSSSLYSELETFPYRNVLKNLKIELSELPQIAVLGAAALFYEWRGMELNDLIDRAV